MTNEQKLAQIAEDMRHEQAMRRLQGDRLDAHDQSLAATHATLNLMGIRLNEIGVLVDKLAAAQAKTESMLQNLIETIAREHSNGKPEGGDAR